jgi:hypothetical protein
MYGPGVPFFDTFSLLVPVILFLPGRVVRAPPGRLARRYRRGGPAARGRLGPAPPSAAGDRRRADARRFAYPALRASRDTGRQQPVQVPRNIRKPRCSAGGDNTEAAVRRSTKRLTHKTLTSSRSTLQTRRRADLRKVRPSVHKESQAACQASTSRASWLRSWPFLRRCRHLFSCRHRSCLSRPSLRLLLPLSLLRP